MDSKKSDASVRERLETNFDVKVVSTSVKSPCFIWLGAKFKNGYGLITVETPEGRKTRYTHREAYRLFVGTLIPGQDVMHKCDVRNCIRPSHLRQGTHKENIADMHRKGRANSPKGESHGCAKLTWAQVKEIRADYKADVPIRTIMAKYGLSEEAVNVIVRNRKWRDASYDPGPQRKPQPLPQFKLTPSQIMDVQTRYVRGVNQLQKGNAGKLAKEFKVSIETIRAMANRRGAYREAA
jgi:hypothetical protein